jgi:hypothetical protein
VTRIRLHATAIDGLAFTDTWPRSRRHQSSVRHHLTALAGLPRPARAFFCPRPDGESSGPGVGGRGGRAAPDERVLAGCRPCPVQAPCLACTCAPKPPARTVAPADRGVRPPRGDQRPDERATGLRGIAVLPRSAQGPFHAQTDGALPPVILGAAADPVGRALLLRRLTSRLPPPVPAMGWGASPVRGHAGRRRYDAAPGRAVGVRARIGLRRPGPRTVRHPGPCTHRPEPPPRAEGSATGSRPRRGAPGAASR